MLMGSRAGPAYAALKRHFTRKLVWMDCLYNPSWVAQELILAQALHCQHEAFAFVASLRTCAQNKDLSRGTRVHDRLLRIGLLENCFDALVTMYAKCGALAKAKQLFDMHKSRDVFTWNALIAGYANIGQGQVALSYYEQMQREGVRPDAVTFTSILKACGIVGADDKGEQIHEEIAKQQLLGNNIVLGNALVSMYAKRGALVKARQVLEELPIRNVISWNALISGYVQHGEGEQALICFEKMQGEGVPPDAVTFISILKACGSIGAADKGEKIHDEIAKQRLSGNKLILGTALVDMYAKCGALSKARHVLEELPVRDVIAWSALIAGYVKKGKGELALKCFEQMQCEGLCPNRVTFILILKACGSIGDIDKGEQIHDEIAKQGLLGSDIVLGTALVDMYAKCGALSKARQVLEELTARTVISWNALITGCVQQGESEQALICFDEMQHEGLYPDAVTFICVLKACGSIQAVDKGEKIHDEIAKQGLLDNDIVLGNALVDMYAKCGALTKAQRVLEELPARDVISWSALIEGYAQQGNGEQALNCFEQMQREGLYPNRVTFISMLKACGSIRAAEKGELIHNEIAKQGLLGDDIILGNALLDMYVKCGALAKARQVLEELPARNVISWSTVIAGYSQEDEGEQALNCFEQMQQEGLCPNAVTFICILKACGSIGAADKGEKIHDEVAKQGLLKDNIMLGTALVEMYAKCNALTKARKVLEELPVRDVISWNALIAGSVQLGECEQALNCFEQMQCEGLSPDAATFSSVLSACSRLGTVEDAQMHFMNMSTKYGLKPDLEHCTSLVDLFGRAGHLDKAVGVIKKLPSSDSGLWCALLGACQKWGDVNVGRWAFEHAVQIDKRDAAVYVLLASIYEAAGMQENAESIETMRKENKALKNSTQSWWVDICGNVRSLFVGDVKSLHRSAKLEDLPHKVSQEKYFGSLHWVSQNVFVDAKKGSL